MAAMEANFLRAVRCAELGRLHFHDLRRIGTRRMARKLPNVIELAAVTGHTSLQMLKRYDHPQAHELAKKLGQSKTPAPITTTCSLKCLDLWSSL